MLRRLPCRNCCWHLAVLFPWLLWVFGAFLVAASGGDLPTTSESSQAPPPPPPSSFLCDIPLRVHSLAEEDRLLDRAGEYLSVLERSLDLQMESLAEYPRSIEEEFTANTDRMSHLFHQSGRIKPAEFIKGFLALASSQPCHAYAEDMRRQYFYRLLSRWFAAGRNEQHRHVFLDLFCRVIWFELRSQSMDMLKSFVTTQRLPMFEYFINQLPMEIVHIVEEIHYSRPYEWLRLQQLTSQLRKAVSKYPQLRSRLFKKLDECMALVEILHVLGPLLLHHVPATYLFLRYEVSQDLFLENVEPGIRVAYFHRYEEDVQQCVPQLIPLAVNLGPIQTQLLQDYFAQLWFDLLADSVENLFQTTNLAAKELSRSYQNVMHLMSRVASVHYRIEKSIPPSQIGKPIMERLGGFQKRMFRIYDRLNEISDVYMEQCVPSTRDQITRRYGKKLRTHFVDLGPSMFQMLGEVAVNTAQERVLPSSEHKLVVRGEETFLDLFEAMLTIDIYDEEAELWWLQTSANNKKKLKQRQRRKKTKAKQTLEETVQEAEDLQESICANVSSSCISEFELQQELEEDRVAEEQQEREKGDIRSEDAPEYSEESTQDSRATTQYQGGRRSSRKRWWLKEEYMKRKAEQAQRNHSGPVRQKRRDLCDARLSHSDQLVHKNRERKLFLKSDQFQVLCKVMGRKEGVLKWREFVRLVFHLHGSVTYFGGSNTRVSVSGVSAVLDRPHPSDEFPFGKRKYTQKLFERVFDMDVDDFEVVSKDSRDE